MADKVNYEGFSVDENNVCTSDGGFVGVLTGGVVNGSTTYTTSSFLNNLSDGDLPTRFIILDGASASSGFTDWTPTIGAQYVISCSDSTNDTAIILSGGITFDGTNESATFADAGDTLIVYCVSASRLVIVENIGGVVLS
jgi:hypothetical protein